MEKDGVETQSAPGEQDEARGAQGDMDGRTLWALKRWEDRRVTQMGMGGLSPGCSCRGLSKGRWEICFPSLGN